MVPHPVLLLLVSELDDEVDNFLATFSNIDVIKGAFSLKKGDAKGEQEEESRFADLSTASVIFLLFLVIGHSGASGEITEGCLTLKLEGLIRTMRFGGCDFRGDFLLYRQEFGSKSDFK